MNSALLLGLIGPWQVVIIVLVILLMFGGKKIPELMRGLGKGMSEFKKGKEEGNEKKRRLIFRSFDSFSFIFRSAKCTKKQYCYMY